VNLKKIKRGIDLSQEFRERAGQVETDADNRWLILGTAATGALRRTSIELTRALADLRRPG
jgi:hypothetical protein